MKSNEPQNPQLNIGAVSGSFYKCIADDYSTYRKGNIYSEESIGKYLIENPKDWKKVLPYPTSKQIIAAFEKNENVTKIIKALKQWQNYR